MAQIDLFAKNEYYVPEMLVAARAMQSGLALLKPHLAAGGSVSAGKVVVGTVNGYLHDIGKKIGAEGYSPDASSAVRLAKALAGAA